MSFAVTQMDLEISQSEVSQTKKDTYHNIMYMWNLKKNGTNELIFKTEIESQMQKANLLLPRGKWGKINWDIGTDIYTLLYIKQIPNRKVLYSTENSTQNCIMIYTQTVSKKEWIYVCV